MFIFVIYYIFDSCCAYNEFVFLGLRTIHNVSLSSIFELKSAFVTACWNLFLKSLIRRIHYFHGFHYPLSIFRSYRCIFSKLHQVILNLHICRSNNFFLVWEWEVGPWWFFWRHLSSWCLRSFGPWSALLFSVRILHATLPWFFLHFDCWFTIITRCILLGVECVLRLISNSWVATWSQVPIRLFSFHYCIII